MNKLKEIATVALGLILMNDFTRFLFTGLAAIAAFALLVFLVMTFKVVAFLFFWGMALALGAAVAMAVGYMVWAMIES